MIVLPQAGDLSEQRERPRWDERPSGLLVPHEERMMQAVDLFAGCGGFSLGMQEAGFDVVAALEWDPCAVQSYLLNLGSRLGCAVMYVDESDRARFTKSLSKAKLEDGWIGSNNGDRTGAGCRAMIVGDASKVSGDDVRAALRATLTDERVDVVFGSPPCTGFSTAGKQDPDDPRNSLVLEFWRIASELGADAVVMENVPPLMYDKKFRPVWDAMVKAANASGYDVVANVVDAANYGVPQFRRRVIVVGMKPGATDRHFQFPMPTHWGFGAPADGKKRWNMRHSGEQEEHYEGRRKRAVPKQLPMFADGGG